MECIKTFLESSTIHGLSYISTTRRCVRVFWSLVVIAGFLIAGALIYRAFQGWEESPETTSIQTLPLSEITFPKVTVCPPMDSFTNLNYDLMPVNKTVPKDLKMKKNAWKILDELVFKEDFKKNKMFFIEEENIFSNWYYGISEINIEKLGIGKESYDFKTGATSGSFRTQNFGSKTSSENMDISNYASVLEILSPKSISLDTHFTRQITIDFVPYGSGKDCKWQCKGFIKILHDGDGNRNLVFNNYTSIARNFTPPPNKIGAEVLLERFNKEKFLGDNVPGFQLIWTTNPKAESREIVPVLQSNAKNPDTPVLYRAIFMKFVNTILISSSSTDNLWDKIKDIRWNEKSKCDSSKTNIYAIATVDWMVTKFELNTNPSDKHQSTLPFKIYDNITEEFFASAGDLFLYLIHCPTKYIDLDSWMSLFDDIGRVTKLSQRLLYLNRLAHTDKVDEKIKKTSKRLIKTLAIDKGLGVKKFEKLLSETVEHCLVKDCEDMKLFGKLTLMDQSNI